MKVLSKFVHLPLIQLTIQADKGTQDANGSALLTCGNIVNRNCSFGNVHLTSGTEDVSIMPMSALNCPLKLELH